MIYEKPKNEIFASNAKDGEIVDFPNVKRGWGVTENLGFIPPMEYFNAAFNRVDKSIAYQLQRGVAEWDKDLEYPIGAVVSLNGIIYVAKSQNTNKTPNENKEIWRVLASEEWCEQTFLNKDEKIDAYTKQESDDKFTQFSHFLSSNAQNGYTKLPNGLIIQWGVDTQVPQGDNTKMTFFPIVFPTACIALTLAHYGAGKEVSAMSYGTPSRTGAIFRHSWPHTPTAVAYIAIGY
ncbi:gp53-like domain-containing protein [Campylobacter concisus]